MQYVFEFLYPTEEFDPYPYMIYKFLEEITVQDTLARGRRVEHLIYFIREGVNIRVANSALKNSIYIHFIYVLFLDNIFKKLVIAIF